MKLGVTNGDSSMLQHSVGRRKIASQSDVSKGTYALEALPAHTRTQLEAREQQARLELIASDSHSAPFHMYRQCCQLSSFPVAFCFFSKFTETADGANLAFFCYVNGTNSSLSYFCCLLLCIHS